MPRNIVVNATPETIEAVLRRIAPIEGVVHVARSRGSSLQPQGDTLSIQATNEGGRAIMAALSHLQVARRGTVSTNAPTSLLCAPHQDSIDRESNESTWDEMAFMIRGDTNLSVNYLLAMGLSGAIAAGGLWTDTLHLIVGAMVVAPGFEPLSRVPFGVVSGFRQLVPTGLYATLAGYLALAAAAAAAALLFGWAAASQAYSRASSGSRTGPPSPSPAWQPPRSEPSPARW